MVHRRDSQVTRRVVRDIQASTAGAAIGPITPGCEIFGVNKGQFSLVDIIAWCLDATGPADVAVSTWTAANADLGFAYRMLGDGRIKSLRFVVDFSFPTRQPEYAAALRERFGAGAIRVTKTHAKFVTIRNDQWNIVIRSSMNLNENRRLETFEVSDDVGMADFLDSLIDELWAGQPEGNGMTQKPYDTCKEFEGLFGGEAVAVDEAAVMASTDARKYFGNGRYDVDIRRAGRTATG